MRVETTDEEQREVDQATGTLRMSRIRATWRWRDHRMKLDLKMEREGSGWKKCATEKKKPW